VTISHSLQSLKKVFLSRWYGLVRREKIVASILVVIMIIGIIGLLNSQSNKWAVQVPANGGTLREGILGTPRFINPVLATSDIDQDLTQLVYSGLIRRDQTNDNSESIIIPDLAESYSISDDGKKYTFILKKNAVFHDGKK
jgi:ABC-type transport system substrate-binding protein